MFGKKRRTAEQQIVEAGLPNDVKLEVGLTQAATVLAMHTVMSGASMLKRLIRLIGADWRAIEEARKQGIDPEAPQCRDWWVKRRGAREAVVHVLYHGFAACGLIGPPSDWPKGHVWVDTNGWPPPGGKPCPECTKAMARHYGGAAIAGGFPLFCELDGQVVLDVRNEQQLTVVRNVLRVREQAHEALRFDWPADTPRCGGSGSVMIAEGPNQLGECCGGCPDCDPYGEGPAAAAIAKERVDDAER
jgi:hypothetical protein